MIGAARCIRIFGEPMIRQRGGRIILIGSAAARRALKGAAARVVQNMEASLHVPTATSARRGADGEFLTLVPPTGDAIHPPPVTEPASGS